MDADARALNDRIDCWFGWPWNDARNAAAFTAELIRSILPASEHADDATGADDTDTDGGPYRSRGTYIDAEPIEILDARCAVNIVLDCLDAYVVGRTIYVPEDAVSEQDPQSRLYWYAKLIGENARRACRVAAGLCTSLTKASPLPSVRYFSGSLSKNLSKNKDDAPDREEVAEQLARARLLQRWIAVGESAFVAAEFIQKLAVELPTAVSGAPDGACNAILGRIARAALTSHGLEGRTASGGGWACYFHVLELDDVQKRVIDWRIRDATCGRTIPEEIIEDLHDAFEAAWMAGRWEFGYSLLDAPDLQREDK